MIRNALWPLVARMTPPGASAWLPILFGLLAGALLAFVCRRLTLTPTAWGGLCAVLVGLNTWAWVLPYRWWVPLAVSCGSYVYILVLALAWVPSPPSPSHK